MTTPAATLRAAAEKVRELAERATPGPWRVVRHGHGAAVEDVGLGHFVTKAAPCDNHWDHWQPDAAWIATMSPAVPTPSIVRAGELPDGWGLLVVRDAGLVSHRQATKREPLPMTPSRIAALMRAVSKTAARLNGAPR